MKNKPLLQNFTILWCIICRKEQLSFEKLLLLQYNWLFKIQKYISKMNATVTKFYSLAHFAGYWLKFSLGVFSHPWMPRRLFCAQHAALAGTLSAETKTTYIQSIYLWNMLYPPFNVDKNFNFNYSFSLVW